MSTKKRLGEMLVDKGLIDKVQLEAAIGRQHQWGGRLGSNLVKLAYISEITLLKFLSSQLKLPCGDLSNIKFNEDTCNLITAEIAKKYHIIPLELKAGTAKKTLFIAMSEPTNILAIDEVSFLTGLTVKPVIATDSQIAAAIDKFYNHRDWIEIEPLTEKITTAEESSPEIIPPEIIHHVSLKEQEEEKKAAKSAVKNPELLALIRVLVKKGLISRDEFMTELKTLKDQK
ncbi:MAG: hypothetical protein RQ824_08865 [bacterium]|nr:hypothetical protein [bacterium]